MRGRPAGISTIWLAQRAVSRPHDARPGPGESRSPPVRISATGAGTLPIPFAPESPHPGGSLRPPVAVLAVRVLGLDSRRWRKLRRQQREVQTEPTPRIVRIKIEHGPNLSETIGQRVAVDA